MGMAYPASRVRRASTSCATTVPEKVFFSLNHCNHFVWLLAFISLVLNPAVVHVVRSAALFGATVNASALVSISDLDDAESWLGYSCASIGDFNGDGLGDFVTGAPGSDSGIGRAYVIYGKGNGSNILPISDVSILTEPDDSYAGLVLGGTAGGTYSNNIGYAVAGAGDVNGDSLADVIVAAYGSSESVVGAAHVIYGTNTSAAYQASYLDLGSGSGGGLDGSDGFTLVGIWMEAAPYSDPVYSPRLLTSQYLGKSVSMMRYGAPSRKGCVLTDQTTQAGDVNADGFDDVIVGSPGAGNLSHGYAHVVFGGSNLPANIDLESDLTGANGMMLEGASADRAGYAVSGGFDVNGDGISDIVIGAPEGETTEENEGMAYVVFGQEGLGESGSTIMLSTDLDGANGFSIAGPSAGAYAGVSVAGVADLDGDGADEVVVGAYADETSGSAQAGGAYVMSGQSNGGFSAEYSLADSPDIDGVTTFLGLAAEDSLGLAVGSAGDLNGDGLGDLWLAAPTASSESVDTTGLVYVIFGKAGGWGAAVDLSEDLNGDDGFVAVGAVAGGHLGWAVAGDGIDLNDDGSADLIMGAFLAPGILYGLFGGEEDADGLSSAVTAAIVTGVIGCLFLTAFEAKGCVEKKQRREAARLANLPPTMPLANHRKTSDAGRRPSQEVMRDINKLLTAS